MPNYTFRNKNTGEEFTEFMKIAERDQYLANHPEYEQIPVSVIPTLDSVRLGVTKPPADFTKHVLGRMKSNITGNNIGNRHFGLAREI